MDYSVSAQYQPALSCFSVQNQHLILRYLAGLAARQYADTTLSAVVTTLNTLIRHLPGRRNVVLTDDITQTTAQDISMFITAAQSSGLMPSTINTKLSILTSFFESLCEEGQMTQQPVLRRRHRLLTPTVLPKPMPDTDLTAFFKAIDAVRDRLICHGGAPSPQTTIRGEKENRSSSTCQSKITKLLVGIELMHMIKKRQMVSEAGDEGLTAAEQFYSLAA